MDPTEKEIRNMLDDIEIIVLSGSKNDSFKGASNNNTSMKTQVENDNMCELCLRGPAEPLLGEMIKRNTSLVHTACLLFSSGVYLNPSESTDISKDKFEALTASCLRSDPRQVKNFDYDDFSRVSQLDTLIHSNYFENICYLCKSKRGIFSPTPTIYDHANSHDN